MRWHVSKGGRPSGAAALPVVTVGVVSPARRGAVALQESLARGDSTEVARRMRGLGRGAAAVCAAGVSSEALDSTGRHAVDLGGLARGPCTTLEQAKRVLEVRRLKNGAPVLLVAGSPTHLRLLQLAVRLLADEGEQSGPAPACAALEMELAPPHVQPRKWLPWRTSAFSAMSSSLSSGAQRPKRKAARALRRISLKGSSSTTASSVERREIPEPSPECIRRIAGAMGTLAETYRDNTSEMLWRRMVLRKIVLSHAPRAPREDGNLGDGCSPYIMMMDGTETDFIFSTMVQGIRSVAYDVNQDLSFDINCRVEKDITLKLYHLVPGQPGKVLLRMHVNVAAAEPLESEEIRCKFPDNEQLVMVTVCRDSIDEMFESASFDPNFKMCFLFGMQEQDRQLHTSGPRAFPSTEGLSGYGGPVSGVVPNLDTTIVLPPLMYKCANTACGKMQYILEETSSSSFEGEETGSRHEICNSCCLTQEVFPSVVRLMKEMRRPLSASTASETTDVASELDGEDPSEITESITPQIPAIASEGVGDQPETESSEASEEAFDVESAVQQRLEIACSVLDITASLSRTRTENDLRAALRTCSNDSEADSAMQRYVSSALESRDRAIMSFRSSERRTVRFNVGTSDDENTQVRFNLPAGIDDDIVQEDDDDYEGYPIARALLESNLLHTVRGMSPNERMDLLAGFFGLSGAYSERLLSDSPMTHAYTGRCRGFGLGEREISRLPEYVYDATRGSSANSSCLVCLSSFETGERVRSLPCFHSYHSICIDRWLVDNPKCPTCQRDASS